MAIQIGKYKRPGIFIEEFDRSVFTSPTLEGITNLVIGVSKKGPVNDIVKITSINDLESIFGPLDRNLERKGSFFHRTISKMLESSPIFALNLLKTDDLLDIIEYKSISSSSGYNNDVKRTGPYRRFFNTSGFWKRDTESFINLTKDNVGYEERVLNFTNLSDKHVSIFVFKTQKEGFDTPLLNWFGSVDKIPPYLNANDYASDYMVDVVVVGGDWSNYQDLSVDPKWGQYFSPSGLRKEQIRNFANDNNVNLLNYYEGLSLIPFFRDTNGRDIFIENNINADTDRTGLFCSFNIDLVETDFRNSTIDLIGHTIAGENETEIEFLSYKETIAESITFKSVPLDLPGNVTSLGNKTGSHTFDSGSGPQISGVINGYDRTSYFSEGSISGVSKTTPIISSTSSIGVEYTSTTDSFAIIGDEYIPVGFGTASLVVTASDYTYSSATVSYTSTTVLDNTGVIKLVSNFANSDNPSVSVTDIVLGYVNFDVFEGQISNVSDVDVSVDGSGYVGLSPVTDYVITESSGVIKVEFQNTNSTPDVKNYKQYRRFKAFNRLISILDSPNSDKVVMKLNSAGEKVSLSGMTLSDVETSSTEHKSFKLDTGLVSGQLLDIISGDLTFYTEDNEMLIGSDSVVSKSSVGNIPSGEGVVGKYSDLYNKFYDGVINTGDFFYSNKIPASIITAGESVEVNLINGEDAVGVTSSYAGLDYIVFDKDMELETFDKIILHGLYIYLVNVQTMGKIFSNYVCFSESPNFTHTISHLAFE